MRNGERNTSRNHGHEGEGGPRTQERNREYSKNLKVKVVLETDLRVKVYRKYSNFETLAKLF